MTTQPPSTDSAANPTGPDAVPDVLLCRSCADRWLTNVDDELCEVCAAAARQGIPMYRWDGQPL